MSTVPPVNNAAFQQLVERLRISNERYELFTRVTHDILWDWDLQRDEVFRNEEGIRTIYGFPSNEPIREIGGWVGRIHPDDRGRVQDLVEAIRMGTKGGDTLEIEYRFLRGDGEYVHIYDRGLIIRDSAGRAIRCVGATQDITERVNARRQLLESEERYRLFFQSNPSPMWVVDVATNKFLEVNQRAIQHYGYSAEEFAEMTVFDIRSDAEQEKLRDALCNKKLEQINRMGRWQHRRKNGEFIYAEVLSHKISYNGINAVLVLANDVTQNVLLQNELLEEKNCRQREVMQAGVAAQEKERMEIGTELHDNVNQILTSAKLYFECVGLYDHNKEDYRMTGIGLILQAIEELRRISKAMVQPRLKDIGLIRSVDDILQNLSLIPNLQVHFCHEQFQEHGLDDGLKLAIYRIIQEQTTNVLKHAAATELHVRLVRDTHCLRLSVKDNGRGFDPAAFHAGTGLTNIINRASLFNGKVDIFSSPGTGFLLTVAFEFTQGIG